MTSLSKLEQLPHTVKPVLFHFWSAMPAQRIRLALAYKGVAHDAIALHRDDDETFFGLGIARAELALRLPDGSVHTDSLALLPQLDGWLGGTPIAVDGASWTALLAWRSRVDAVLARLHAPVTPAFADVGADATTLMAYKADIQHRFGMSVEALSNDRYDGYLQFATLSHLPELGRHLSQQRFYLGGKLSACDLVLACDLFPLQLLDGVTLPMDLLYYIERVEKACGASLRDGLIMQH